MKKLPILTLSYLCMALVFTGALRASEEPVAPVQEEAAINAETINVIVGNRRMSHAEHVRVQEQRACEEQEAIEEQGEEFVAKAQDDEENAASSVVGSKEALAGGAKKASKKAGIYFTSHQGAYHTPLSVSLFGDTVTLEDGSIWSVSGSDCFKTLNWLTSDLLVISPNSAWFSVYDYVITNQNTGAAVQVNLIVGPLYSALYRHWIVAIDYALDHVVLEDGSIWTLYDSTIYKNWVVGDTVIIGINDSWFSSTSYPNILINVNTLNYARGNCVY